MKTTHTLALACAAAALLVPTAQAVTILGTGTGALLGNDLTDPEDDGAPNANTNYDAIFSASQEPGFGGGEFAFNVFDNRVGPGNDKWCCGNAPTPSPSNPIWVQAEFDRPIHVTHFTLTSGNDVPARDPVDWQILGSNDGSSFTPIFTQTGAPALWTARNQVIRWDSGVDYVRPDAYTHIRFQATKIGSGTLFQLNEFEIFGVPSGGSTLPMLLGSFVGFFLLRSKRKA